MLQPDLAVANAGSGDVSVLLNNGNGTFAPQRTFRAGTRPTEIVAGPFNVPSSMAEHASSLYSRNLLSLIELGFDYDDDVIKGACVVRDGKVVQR